MEKTLQTQYNLIKEGKGDKAYFLKSAYRLFPDMLSPVNTFEDTTRILKNRGIISENIGGLVTTGKKQDWHAIFNENITTLKEEKEAKAEEKETTKEVTDMATRGYDYKDEKNYDNIFGEEFLKGYYTEMKDPANADKDVEELRAIVAKNLAKDISYYVKNGQFGVKGLGYQTEAPGLGEPKEPKGKFKSSGYGDLKENEEKDFNLWKTKLYNIIMVDAGLDKEDIAVDEFEIKKYWKEGKTPEEVYNNIWIKDAGNFRAIGESFKPLKESVLRLAIQDIIKEVLSEALDKGSIKEEGESAKKEAMKKRITNEMVVRKKKIKALQTLTELDEEVNEETTKKLKELQSEIKQLEGMAAKLDGKKKKTAKKEDEIEEGPDDLYNLKNPQDARKGFATTINPDDATEKSPTFQAKYKKA